MDIENKLQIIFNYHDHLKKRHTSLVTEIAQLTAKGCIDAKEHWKDGKYLCLLFKMRKGVRRKTYIGNHPLRISEARQKLQNYKDRLNCIEIQKRIQSDLDEIELVTQQLLSVCARFDMAALFALQGDDNGDKILSLMRGSSQGLYPKYSHSLSSETV